MGNTVVITGANRGIGLELARQFQARGDQVVGVCRSSSPELTAIGAKLISGIDVADDSAGARLVEALGEISVDLLINNAGILRREDLDDLDLASIRAQLEVNALGPLKISQALLPRMPKGAKIAIITSRMGSIGDNTSGGRYGYRMSKAAVNMAGKSLAIDLAPRGISVAVLHPGFVRTEMTGHAGMIDADESARGLIARIDELGPDNSGTFWHTNGEVLPW